MEATIEVSGLRKRFAATTALDGMTFTVEPMLTLGGYDWFMWDDKWTVLTKDGSWAAQWEHTIVVTDDGVRILTSIPKGLRSVE